jgi:hypothetical protein
VSEGSPGRAPTHRDELFVVQARVALCRAAQVRVPAVSGKGGGGANKGTMNHTHILPALWKRWLKSSARSCGRRNRRRCSWLGGGSWQLLCIGTTKTQSIDPAVTVALIMLHLKSAEVNEPRQPGLHMRATSSMKPRMPSAAARLPHLSDILKSSRQTRHTDANISLSGR